MADKDKTEKTEVVKLPTSKRHKVLTDIDQQLQGLEIEDIVELAGKKYQMSTLTADEEVWADSFTNLASPVSATSSMRLARLSAAIKSVDGIPVSELFEFSDETDEADKSYHTESQYRMRYWEMSQMMLWLGKLSGKIIVEMWRGYTGVIERRDAVWDEIKKSSAGKKEETLGGKSNPSSSHEKESSSAAQTSSA